MKITYIILLTFLISMCMTVAVSAQTRGLVTGNKVNVRDNGCINDSTILYRVDQGEPVEILGVTGDYYLVNVKQDEQVYIASDYIRVKEVMGMVFDNSGVLYDLPPDFNGLPIGMIYPGERVVIEASTNDWYKINGGYIEKHYLSVPDFVPIPEERIKSGSLVYSNADDIIEFAKTYLGAKYIYGSMNPNRGFDCSGYISYIFDNFDIPVNRSSASMAHNGFAVAKDDLIKGDLVFFATSGGNRISHVGLYIGNGQFIHSSSDRDGVMIDEMNNSYYQRNYVKAVRIL